MTVRLIFLPTAFIISFDGNMKFEVFYPIWQVRMERQGKRMRLLIAEDEPDLAEALTVFLKRTIFRWMP